MRTLAELRDVDDPAWPHVEAAIADADAPVRVLPVAPGRGEQTLVDLQVTARSVLGALALHTGGILVDHGWLRLLGGGEPHLDLAQANGLPLPTGTPPGRLVVGVDVLGGTFAINGGDLPGEPGEVAYFAPDDLAWLPMEMGHGAFVTWSFTDRLAMFNEHLRWPGWAAEVEPLATDQGIGLYPYPSTEQGKDLATVSRRPMPLAEITSFWDDLARQLDGR